jgi:antitoxin component YwqK of YwqJK toxin-antitoxin module
MFCCFSGYSQENTQKIGNKKIIKVEVHYDNGQLKTKGKKKLQIIFSLTSGGRSNGVMTFLKQGRWVEYYRNGNKKRIIIYDKGDVIKEVRNWNKDGTKSRDKDNKTDEK